MASRTNNASLDEEEHLVPRGARNASILFPHRTVEVECLAMEKVRDLSANKVSLVDIIGNGNDADLLARKDFLEFMSTSCRAGWLLDARGGKRGHLLLLAPGRKTFFPFMAEFSR